MTTCIYHGNGADGFSAAWVVRHALGNDVTFYAGKYGKPAPDVTGEVVYIVDFSYSREVLAEMAATAKHIVVLDHHKTAAEALEGLDLPNVTVVFDMKRSGCRITWDYFFPTESPPALLLHVEDRDLWWFELTGTHEIVAALFSYPYDFDVWTGLMKGNTVDLYVDGTAILRKQRKDIAELIKSTAGHMLIDGRFVPAANMPYIMASDAGEIMARGEPFAAVFWDTPEGRQFSLRSHVGGADVAELAQAFGGGGHARAAGFRVPHDHPLATARLVTA